MEQQHMSGQIWIDRWLSGGTPESRFNVPVRARTACPGFHWIGQTWEHCDECGRPWHEHEGMLRPKPGSGIFDNEWEVVPWGA
jgi:hypothetical protein